MNQYQSLKQTGDLLASDNVDAVLRGTTLEVYRFLLKNNKPVGVRAVQRALNLSSPSLALYHLSKLEDVGLLSRQNGDYRVNKVVLEDMIKISRFLIPRFLFYALFTLVAFVMELTVFKPDVWTSGYFFATAITVACTIGFGFETVKKLKKK